MRLRQKAGTVIAGAVISVVASTGVAAAQSSPPPTVLEVQGETVTRPAELPRTGSDLGPAYVGAGLTAIGAVLVIVARRRKSAPEPTPTA